MGSDRLPTLLGFLLCVLTLLGPARAFAQRGGEHRHRPKAHERSAPLRSDACSDAVAALEDLAVEDRVFLTGFCRFDDAQIKRWREGASNEKQRLYRLVRRLASRSEWEVRVLLQVLKPALFDERVAYAWQCRKTKDLRSHVERVLEARTRYSGQVASGAPLVISSESVLPEDCIVGLKPTEAAGEELAVTPETVPLILMAPPGMRVRLLLVDEKPSFQVLEESRAFIPAKSKPGVAKNGGPPAAAQPLPEPAEPARNFGLYVALVKHGAEYVLVLDREQKDRASASNYPLVFRGTASGMARAEPNEVLRSGCLDVQTKSDDRLKFLVDGVEIEADRVDRLQTMTVWIPSEQTQSQHRLTILDEREPEPLLNRTIIIDRSRVDPCTELKFDLTTRKLDDTVGLLQVDADACVDAGIDTPKLHSYVTSFLVDSAHLRVRDLPSWALAAQYVGDLRRSLGELGGSAVGAERGHLDTIRNFGSGAEELLRQGFSSLLIASLRCSKKGASGWDYSFIARRIDIKALRQSVRDPIIGIEDLEKVERTGIELVTNPNQLGPSIDLALGQLVQVPVLLLGSLPEQQSFPPAIHADVEVYAPAAPNGQPRNLAVAMAARTLSGAEAAELCPRVSDMRRLRARRDMSDFDAGIWRGGTAESVLLDGVKRRHVALEFQPVQAATLLVRASLNESEAPHAPLAVGYSCIDVSRSGAGMWAEIGGWFPLGADAPGRTEESATFTAMLGIDWQQRLGWLDLGGGVGYSHTVRTGRAPSTWSGLNSDDFAPDGSLAYTVRENAAYLLFQTQVRGTLCQPWWPSICTSATRRTMLTGRLLAMPGLHLISLEGVNPSLTEFTGGVTHKSLIDVGLIFQPGFAVQFSRTTTFNGRLSFGTNRLVDLVSRSPARAEVDGRLLWGASMGLSWDL